MPQYRTSESRLHLIRVFSLQSPAAARALHSFPTRRSSDLRHSEARWAVSCTLSLCRPARLDGLDRKSTRLNSSHLGISYAVFCLKNITFRTRRSPDRCL